MPSWQPHPTRAPSFNTSTVGVILSTYEFGGKVRSTQHSVHKIPLLLIKYKCFQGSVWCLAHSPIIHICNAFHPIFSKVSMMTQASTPDPNKSSMESHTQLKLKYPKTATHLQTYFRIKKNKTHIWKGKLLHSESQDPNSRPSCDRPCMKLAVVLGASVSWVMKLTAFGLSLWLGRHLTTLAAKTSQIHLETRGGHGRPSFILKSQTAY